MEIHLVHIKYSSRAYWIFPNYPASFSVKISATDTDTAGKQDLRETSLPRASGAFSGKSHASACPKLQRPPGQDDKNPKEEKSKALIAIFEPKNSHVLSMAKDTNKNPVSSSAGTFSWRVGFNLDDTLTPICLPYFPVAAKCWGGVSVFIFEFPAPWIHQLEWEQKEIRWCFSASRKWFRQDWAWALIGHPNFPGLSVITFASAAECSRSISR